MWENKQDLSRIIKIVDENLKSWRFVLGFCIFGSLFSLFWIIISAMNDILRGWLGFGLMMIVNIVWLSYRIDYCEWYKSLRRHLKNGTALEKKVEIESFQYYRDYDLDKTQSLSGEWYFVICYSWWHKFETKMEWAHSYLHWWCNVDIIDKNYCEEKWVPYSPNDPNYDEDAINRKIKNIWGRIELLEKQLKEEKWGDKSELREKLWQLNDEMKKMVPPYIVYRNRRYYIWDELTVYVNPNNHKTYIIDI